VTFSLMDDVKPIHQTVIFESTSEDYTTDSAFLEDSTEET